ncbi:hypothetical protein LTR53_012690, partial [Teratosphaeriaceae sp. CCFEE 6253]
MDIGIGTGVGGVILVAIVVLVTLILRKRTQHRRAVTELEHHLEAVTATSMQEIGEVPRPISIARCGAINPLHAKGGWGALYSDESVHQSGATAWKGGRIRNSVSLPKRIRQRALPLEMLKHLSAIIESPRSKTARSPSPAVHDRSTERADNAADRAGRKKTVHLVAHQEDEEDVFVMPGSPKPHVLPSFAIRSPGMYGAAIANDDRPMKASRSISVGALHVPEGAVFGHPSGPYGRPQMHSRSISLGAPQSRPPSGPVPPVPRVVLRERQSSGDTQHRDGLCVSRMSTSSRESASSSVLVASVIKTMHADKPLVGSPRVEDVVADDESAQLKTVSNGRWQDPQMADPQRQTESTAQERAAHNHSTGQVHHQQHPSIRSNTARYSAYSQHRLSTASTVSSISDTTHTNRLSIPQIGTADRVSISRVSSYSSLHTAAGAGESQNSLNTSAMHKIVTTPRRTSRVSMTGSPAERRKTSVLREISSNANANLQLTPSRQTSDSTVQTDWSARSSNGNPFQWDSQSLPLLVTKPSALKGSPTSKGSRKGHKRQNCVRISTLQPQVLGPPPSRPTSPSLMHGIEEEDGGEHDGDLGKRHGDAGMTFVRHEKLPRLSSASSLAANLKVKSVRVSLTPSSPTLSTWAAEQQRHEQGAAIDMVRLPSQPSDSQLSTVSVSPAGTGVGRLTAARQSPDRSSGGFSIPAFPSPSKATVGAVQWHQQTIPEFSLSRPSTDGPEEVEPETWFAQQRPHTEPKATSPGLPSSPPLPASKQHAYDPAWAVLAIAAPAEGIAEYDPASPVWPADTDAIPSSPPNEDLSSPSFFPFALHDDHGPAPEALHFHDDAEHVSPRTKSGSRPSS